MVPSRAPTSTDIAARRRSGFTLLEMMIVIAIVGIMAMTIAPSLSEALLANRHGNAAQDLVRFGRNIRSQAIATGASQMMRYQQASSGGLGRIGRYTGMNNKCLQTDWNYAMTGAGHGEKQAWAFDMQDYNPREGGAPSSADDDRQVIVLQALSPGDAAAPNPVVDVQLCYQPDGAAYIAYPGGTMRPQAFDLEFTFRRTLAGVRHGVDRVVVFPAGGNARLQ